MFAYKVVYNEFKFNTVKFFGVFKAGGVEFLSLARPPWLRDDRYRGLSLVMSKESVEAKCTSSLGNKLSGNLELFTFQFMASSIRKRHQNIFKSSVWSSETSHVFPTSSCLIG